MQLSTSRTSTTGWVSWNDCTSTAPRGSAMNTSIRKIDGPTKAAKVRNFTAARPSGAEGPAPRAGAPAEGSRAAHSMRPASRAAVR